MNSTSPVNVAANVQEPDGNYLKRCVLEFKRFLLVNEEVDKEESKEESKEERDERIKQQMDTFDRGITITDGYYYPILIANNGEKYKHYMGMIIDYSFNNVKHTLSLEQEQVKKYMGEYTETGNDFVANMDMYRLSIA